MVDAATYSAVEALAAEVGSRFGPSDRVTVHGPPSAAARDRPGGAWAREAARALRPRCLPSTSPAATAPRDSANSGFLVLGG